MGRVVQDRQCRTRLKARGAQARLAPAKGPWHGHCCRRHISYWHWCPRHISYWHCWHIIWLFLHMNYWHCCRRHMIGYVSHIGYHRRQWHCCRRHSSARAASSTSRSCSRSSERPCSFAFRCPSPDTPSHAAPIGLGQSVVCVYALTSALYFWPCIFGSAQHGTAPYGVGMMQGCEDGMGMGVGKGLLPVCCRLLVPIIVPQHHV